MRILITDITAFKAALSVAPKNDVRFYLQGICFDPEHQRIVATNGSLLMWADVIEEHDLTSQTIIGLADRSIPAKTKSIIITDDGLACYEGAIPSPKEKLRIIPIEIIEADYPNYLKLIVPPTTRESITQIGINPSLLNAISKHDKESLTTFQFRKQNDGIDVSFTGKLLSVKALLMPIREAA